MVGHHGRVSPAPRNQRQMNDMRLQDLQHRIAHAQYVVDADAVAEAMLQHGAARGLLGLIGAVRASEQTVLVPGELHRPAV
jgi:hypothetical protein